MTIGSIGEQAYTGGISGMYGIDGEQTVSESTRSRPAGEVPPAGTIGADYESKAPLNPPAGSYSSDSLSSANGACASFFGSVLALIQEMASDFEAETGIDVDVYADASVTTGITQAFGLDKADNYDDLYFAPVTNEWLSWAASGKMADLSSAMAIPEREGYEKLGVYEGKKYVMNL